LVHDFLLKANSGELLARTATADDARAKRERLDSHRKTLQAMVGGSLTIPGAILTALETGPWFLWGYSTIGVLLLVTGAWQLFKSLK
jgi:hypothetical protein